MGTRSIVRFVADGVTLVSVYQQFDGYLIGGVGEALAKFLSSRPVVNGISGDDHVFNGIPCMAAQFIRDFKGPDSGGLYIYPPDCEWQECNYTVEGGYDENWKPKPIKIGYHAHGDKFDGSIAEFKAYIEEQKSKQED